jgi:hypothetical protein
MGFGSGMGGGGFSGTAPSTIRLDLGDIHMIFLLASY